MIFLLSFTFAFTGNGGYLYSLPHSSIFVESETVLLNGKTLKRYHDYEINYNQGKIRFFHPLTAKDTVFISYDFLPFKIEKEYMRWREKRKRFLREKKESFKLEGTRTIRGSLSSMGFEVDHGINVRGWGRMGETDINVFLVDENLAGEGEVLREIDRVYFEAQNPGFFLRIGDLDEENLLGIKGRYGNGSIFMGISRGRWTRKIIEGEDGKSGPYKLTEGGIIPGSERVFIDGREIPRGYYRIDAEEGEIYFLPPLYITPETEIAVEFMEVPEDVRRGIFGGEIETEWGKAGVEKSVEYPLNESLKVISFHPESLLAWVDGGRYVGEGEGEYDKIDSIYIYRGYRKGSWKVSFEWVGEGKGNYRYNSELGGDEWVGEGNGEWVARKKIYLPTDEEKIFVDVNAFGIKGRIEGKKTERKFVPGEWKGGKVELSGKWQRGWIGFEGKLIGFTPGYIKREDAPPVVREWKRKDFEKLASGVISISPLPFLEMRAGYGMMDSLKKTLYGARFFFFDVQWENIPGILKRERGRFEWGRIRIEGEREENKGEIREKIEGRAGIGRIAFGGGWRRREDTQWRIFMDSPVLKMNSIFSLTPTGRNITHEFFLRLPVRWKNLTGDIFMGLSQVERRKYEVHYREVPEGAGNYSRDSLGHYYEDPYGNYVREFVPVGEGERILSKEVNGNLSWRGIWRMDGSYVAGEKEKMDFNGTLEHGIYLSGRFHRLSLLDFYEEEWEFKAGISIKGKRGGYFLRKEEGKERGVFFEWKRGFLPVFGVEAGRDEDERSIFSGYLRGNAGKRIRAGWDGRIEFKETLSWTLLSWLEFPAFRKERMKIEILYHKKGERPYYRITTELRGEI